MEISTNDGFSTLGVALLVGGTIAIGWLAVMISTPNAVPKINAPIAAASLSSDAK